ncbi:MAG: tyrosine-type recombinase/integrase [Microbacterium gubbeenense]|uniref:tyrosine-type recombinase/integrase n=1 Tax=Microbacterium gubbeenense TaxID=159896 RepID=UPI003F97BC35
MYLFDEAAVEAQDAPDRSKHGPKGRRRPKRRADGEGSVFPVERKRKDGSRVIYYRAAKTVELGSERKKITAQARTEREAIEKRDRKILEERVAYGLESPEAIPLDPRIAKLTVGDCLTDWLSERRRDGLSPATIHMYDARIRNHLLPVWGSKPVRTVTYEELKRFFAIDLPAKGLGVDSIRQTFICLKSAMEYYHRDGILLRHPMVGLKPPPKNRKPIARVKEIRQASKFLSRYLLEYAKAADQEARWFLALYGLRQGEALGMTDSSLEGHDAKTRGRRIIVRQQIQRVSAEHGCRLDHSTGRWSCGKQSTNCPRRIGEPRWEIRGTKTENGYREIVISEEAWQMLIAHRNRQQDLRKLPSFKPEEGAGLDKLLFTRPDGKPIYAQRDRQALEELVSTITPRPSGMTVHTLRHIATTMLIDGGAEREKLISVMGWSSRNADSQIATYSSADTALLAAETSLGHGARLYGAGRRSKPAEDQDG